MKRFHQRVPGSSPLEVDPTMLYLIRQKPAELKLHRRPMPTYINSFEYQSQLNAQTAAMNTYDQQSNQAGMIRVRGAEMARTGNVPYRDLITSMREDPPLHPGVNP